jgi:hypothetical protein
MATLQRTPPFGGVFLRRFTRFSGLYFDEFSVDTAWIRETAAVRLPPMEGVAAVVLRGEFLPHPSARGLESGFPVLEITLDGRPAGLVEPGAAQTWEARVTLEPGSSLAGSVIGLRLRTRWPGWDG